MPIAGSPPAPPAEAAAPPALRAHGWRKLSRRLGAALVVLGVLVLAWAGVIVFFGDPFTGIYEHWRQHQLSHQLDQRYAQFARLPVVAHVPRRRLVAPAVVRRNALLFSRRVHEGDAIGRIRIPSIHVSQVVIDGTSTADLRRGPGRYLQTSYPGLRTVTAIAGHRTTYGAPFRDIDRIKPGQRIRLLMPYGTFVYRVSGHRVVVSNDWSIIRPHGYDELVLSACHPRFFASHRWVVFARLVRIAPPERKS